MGLAIRLLSNHHCPTLDRLAADIFVMIGRVTAASTPV